MNTELIQYACLPTDLNENILNELWTLRPEEQNKITMFGKTIDTPRRFKVYGKTYKFNGMTEEAEEEIPRLIIPYLNLINTIDTGYNSVLVNWYDGGTEYIGYHSDKTDHLVPNSNIYGISFGSERIMRFKHKEDNTLIDFKLEHNSIINMIGGCQSVFQHSIIKNNKISGRRISLTFRKIIDTNIIMESKTRPKYNEFLKEWSAKNKITSFFGSDKPEFLQAWNNVKSGGSKIVEPVIEAPAVKEVAVISPVVEQTVKPKVSKQTITFSEADKKKMEGMTRNERINYAIRLSKKYEQINRVVDTDLFDFTKHLGNNFMIRNFFNGVVKGSVTPQNKYFKMNLLRFWSIDNKKKIDNIDKMLVGELDKALKVRGIDVNELFEIGKKYYEEH